MKPAYSKLPLILGVHFVVMYAITYAMVVGMGHVFLNVNRAYMAGMMVAPMVPLMLLAMPSMFPNRRANVALGIGGLAVFGVLLAAAQSQALVGDRQFLRSMIPHHSSAIVMCEKSGIDDPEIVALCDKIVRSQNEEIAEMKRLMEKHERPVTASK